MKVTVWVTSRFVGYHRWEDAPEDVGFLRNWHRHVFHVKLGVPVKHDNRDVEFFQLKVKLDAYLTKYHGQRFEYSCEQIAAQILGDFNADFAEVSEDGENGATVERSGRVYADVQDIKEGVKSQCFVGNEVEGPYRSQRTLFVPGSVTPDQFRYAYKNCGPIRRVYYGAGNDRKIKLETLEAILKECHPTCLTVEINSLQTCRINPGSVDGVTVVSWDKNDAGSVQFIKMVGEGVVVWRGGPGVRHTNFINDSMYADDEYVD